MNKPKDKKPVVTRTLAVDKERWEELKEYAWRNRTSVSQVLRDQIEKVLDKEQGS